MSQERFRPATSIIGPIREVMKTKNRQDKSFAIVVSELFKVLGKSKDSIELLGTLSSGNIKPVGSFLEEFDKLTGKEKLTPIVLLEILKRIGQIDNIDPLGVEIFYQHRQELQTAIQSFKKERIKTKEQRRSEKGKTDKEENMYKTIVRPIKHIIDKHSQSIKQSNTNDTFLDIVYQLLSILGKNSHTITEIGAVRDRTIKPLRDLTNGLKRINATSSESLIGLLQGEGKIVEESHKLGADLLYTHIQSLEASIATVEELRLKNKNKNYL